MGDMSYSKFGFGGVFLDAMRQASLLSQNPQRPDFILGLERVDLSNRYLLSLL